jgi:putative hemolysin
MLISQSTEHGELDKSEEEMLKGVFEFSETIAREVMTPRTDLVTIPVDAPLEEILETVTSSG